MSDICNHGLICWLYQLERL